MAACRSLPRRGIRQLLSRSFSLVSSLFFWGWRGLRSGELQRHRVCDGLRLLRHQCWHSPSFNPAHLHIDGVRCAGELAVRRACGKLAVMHTTVGEALPPHNMSVNADVLAAGFRLPMGRRLPSRYVAEEGI